MLGQFAACRHAVVKGLIVVALLGAGFCCAHGQVVHGDSEEVDVSALCQGLGAEFAGKDARDGASIVWIYETFERYFTDASKAEQRSMVKALRKVLISRPCPRDATLQCRAAECLSSMGAQGKKALIAASKSKSLLPRDDKDEARVVASLMVRVAIFEAIGTFVDPKTINLLIKTLNAKEAELIIAASQALSGFHELPLRQRKTIVEALIRRLEDVSREGIVSGRKAYNLGKRGPRVGDREKYETVGLPLSRALSRLTGQTLCMPDNWRTWYNLHKKDKHWEPGMYADDWGRLVICSDGTTRPRDL